MEINISDRQAKIIREALAYIQRIDDLDEEEIEEIRKLFLSERLKREEDLKKKTIEAFKESYLTAANKRR